jgi:hypothetical protein
MPSEQVRGGPQPSGSRPTIDPVDIRLTGFQKTFQEIQDQIKANNPGYNPDLAPSLVNREFQSGPGSTPTTASPPTQPQSRPSIPSRREAIEQMRVKVDAAWTELEASKKEHLKTSYEATDRLLKGLEKLKQRLKRANIDTKNFNDPNIKENLDLAQKSLVNCEAEYIKIVGVAINVQKSQTQTEIEENIKKFDDTADQVAKLAQEAESKINDIYSRLLPKGDKKAKTFSTS